MPGVDHQQSKIFSYLSPEMRVRTDHPLRAIRTMMDDALANLSPLFDRMYAATALLDFARRNEVTQIFVTRPRGRLWAPLFSRDPVQKIISRAKDMQIVIVSDRELVER
jgi:K+-sensing histidine kinase KdpD